MISVIKTILCIHLTLYCIPDDSPEVFSSIGGMPQIPFSVYYMDYNKTIHVLPGCEASNKAIVLEFESSETDISGEVFKAVTGAFDKPGITEIKVCRVNN